MKPAANAPVYETEVWVCSNSSCTCWMRDSLTFEEEPSCPLCGNSMVRDVRMLPKIVKPK